MDKPRQFHDAILRLDSKDDRVLCPPRLDFPSEKASFNFSLEWDALQRLVSICLRLLTSSLRAESEEQVIDSEFSDDLKERTSFLTMFSSLMRVDVAKLVWETSGATLVLVSVGRECCDDCS